MHLRVWWTEEERTGFMQRRKIQKSGIVICGDCNCFQIRTDDGELYSLGKENIKRSEWVNHPSAGV